MNWDDLRFVLALARAGSLTRAAKALGVDHTTVGRRIDACEESLGVRLFTRSRKGYLPTADAERLLERIESVEEAVHALERGADAQASAIEGTVRITSSETFGVAYLAPRLARLAQEHPRLSLSLLPIGDVLDLARREADIAVRAFRSKHESLVVRRAAEVAYGLYASRTYLGGRVPKKPKDLAAHRILTTAMTPGAVDAEWVASLTGGATPAMTSELTLVLHAAARAGGGIAVLPRYLGDADETLAHVPMPNPPVEPIWVTVHRDVRSAPRVRLVLDFLAAELRRDRALLLGR